MSTYKYASISDDKHAFRLLKLHKGYINEPIRCHLWQTILPQNEIDRENQLVDYIALSYTWGGQGKSAEIEVNGCGMRVTENLYSALRHLRTEVEDQDFWVDAICIDQGNPDERSHQVGLMRRIYQEAFGVYVWLGGSTTETDAAMDAMTKLEQLRTKIGKEWRFFAEKRIQLEPYSRERDVLGDHPVRAGLEQLLGRPWFRRIWILQEIGSARMAQIYCGKKHVSARIFAQFPALLCYIPDAHCQAVLDIMPGFSREESWWSKNQDLHTLLRQFRNSQATEERDMIYALLGISEEATEKNTIEVDYKPETPIQKVVRRTMCSILFHVQEELPLYNFLDWDMKRFLRSLDHLGSLVLEETLDRGDAAAIRHLVAKGCLQINIMTDIGWKLYRWATENNDQPAIELLRSTHEPGRLSPTETHSLLSKGMAAGYDIEILDWVNRDNIKVELKDHEGRTLLSHAAEYGSTAIIQVLRHLATNQDPVLTSSEDHNKRTPLSFAAENGHVAIVQELIEGNHANEDPEDDWGRTALSYAAGNGHVKVAELLIQCETVRKDAKDKFGRSPLSYAAMNGRAAVVKMLLACDSVDSISRCHAGRTPLSYVSESGDTATAMLLGSHQTGYVDSKDNIDRTPLSYAVEKGHGELVQYLIGEGADVHLMDGNKLTPLQYALHLGYVEWVELLETPHVPHHFRKADFFTLAQQCILQTVDIDLRSAAARNLIIYAIKQGYEEEICPFVRSMRFMHSTRLVGSQHSERRMRSMRQYVCLTQSDHVTVLRYVDDVRSSDLHSPLRGHLREMRGV